MKDTTEYKKIFDQYGGMMRTKELQAENILYRPLQKLIEQGHVEKIRYGYYQWVDYEDFSEVDIVIRLFPDAILCFDTALRYYGYSDRTPADWHLAVSKDSGKSRFKIDYPFVKPYYVEPALLQLGLTKKFSIKRYRTTLQIQVSVFPNYWSMLRHCGSKRPQKI